MRIQYMMLCEHVRLGPNNIFDALGVLDRIIAKRLPAAHPALAVVALFISEGDDDLGDFDTTVLATMPSGQLIFEGNGRLTLKAAPGTTWLSSARMVFQMQGLPLTEYGRYWFKVAIGATEASHPLDVVEPPAAP